MRASFPLLGALLVLLAAAGCGTDSGRDDLSDASFDLVDADGQTVVFPDDLRGDVAVVGYVYANCPDVCPMTTANMRNVREALGAPDDVRFVTVTFDPVRDTPEALRRYRDAFGLGGTDWLFLSADTTTTRAFMDRLDVRYRRADRGAQGDSAFYFIDHTDQITLIDRQGRVFFHYGGSMTPPEILVEDINKLRDEPS